LILTVFEVGGFPDCYLAQTNRIMFSRMENDPATELARLDRVEWHLRRCGAFDETAKRELALARDLARTRGLERPSEPFEPLESVSAPPDSQGTAGGSGPADAQQG